MIPIIKTSITISFSREMGADALDVSAIAAEFGLETIENGSVVPTLYTIKGLKWNISFFKWHIRKILPEGLTLLFADEHS